MPGTTPEEKLEKLIRTRRIQINVRLSEYEDKQLEQEAIKQDCTKSDLVRKLICRLPKPKKG